MLFSFKITAFLAATAALAATAQDAAAPECAPTWQCQHISVHTNDAPTLDADLGEWAQVNAYTSDMVMPTGTPYNAGDVSYKCQYDDTNVYFAFEIPGDYRFNATDNHFCAAIGTMFKVGSKATYLNMGGCPDAFGGCPDGPPDTCDDYLVDIGAHWELSGTEQNTFYGVSTTAETRQEGTNTPAGGSGNDLIANKDDEYAVSSFCRFDDDDADAGNEWSGAWAHTNPIEGEYGTYKFEMSRSLTTASTKTDAQLVPGTSIEFGVAFWDPYETEETGWSKIGHYITGCGTDWIHLELVDPNAAPTTATDEAPTDGTSTTTATDADVPSGASAISVTAGFLSMIVVSLSL